MNSNDTKAVVRFADNDLFVATSPSGHARVVNHLYSVIL